MVVSALKSLKFLIVIKKSVPSNSIPIFLSHDATLVAKINEYPAGSQLKTFFFSKLAAQALFWSVSAYIFFMLRTLVAQSKIIKGI